MDDEILEGDKVGRDPTPDLGVEEVGPLEGV